MSLLALWIAGLCIEEYNELRGKQHIKEITMMKQRRDFYA